MLLSLTHMLNPLPVPPPLHIYRCFSARKKFREGESCHKSPPSTKDFREMAKEVMIKVVQEVWKDLGEGKALTHNCRVTRSQKRKLRGSSIREEAGTQDAGEATGLSQLSQPKHNPQSQKEPWSRLLFQHPAAHSLAPNRGRKGIREIFTDLQGKGVSNFIQSCDIIMCVYICI